MELLEHWIWYLLTVKWIIYESMKNEIEKEGGGDMALPNGPTRQINWFRQPAEWRHS